MSSFPWSYETDNSYLVHVALKGNRKTSYFKLIYFKIAIQSVPVYLFAVLD